MADKKNIIPIKTILIFIIALTAFFTAKFTENNLFMKIVAGEATFATLLGLFYLSSLRNDLIKEWKNSYESIKALLQKIAPFKKQVLIDSALKDKEIARKINSILINNKIGSALIKGIKELETNENLQNANVIITLYYSDEVPLIWIEEHLRFYTTIQVSPKFSNRSFKVLVGTTQEKKAKIEEYITNNVRKLNIGVIKLGEKQDYENLLSIIREKLRG